MKAWEKIMLYPIGLFIWLTDNGSKKWKSAVALALAAVMLAGMLPAGVMAVSGNAEEQQIAEELQENLGLDAVMDMVALGDGKYIAVFLQDVAARDTVNNQAAYYAIYDGSWSEPVILDDDGTKDETPAIDDLGNGQLFITWASASRVFTNETWWEMRNARDIKGVFVDKATMAFGNVIEVTTETQDEAYGDHHASAVYDPTSGWMIICYIKSECTKWEEESGVDGYSSLVYRVYDTATGEFISVDGSISAGWYDQVLLDTDPAVTVNETLDKDGYWTQSPEITMYESWPALSEMDAAYCNGKAVIAYMIDHDGDLATANDRDVYVMLYTFADDSVTTPIAVTCTDVAETNLAFKAKGDVLNLTYDAGEQKVTFNASTNFFQEGILKKGFTWDEESYYYLDKSRDSGFVPAKVKKAPGFYLDVNGEGQQCTEFTTLTNETTWESGWYYVDSDLIFTSAIKVSGDVHLILGDEVTLEAEKGINVSTGNSLTIYGQSVDENMGALKATASGNLNAAIGGFEAAAGNITINGGAITASTNTKGAAIGGGRGNGGNITINGGSVTATTSNDGAAIGGSDMRDGGNITINSGTITATSSDQGAAIGGGTSGDSGNIIINGGSVTATASKDGAAIGGGYSGDSENITINGGTIVAKGNNYVAGIGGGRDGDGRYITINGGSVTATGGNYGAGIGGGRDGDGENITINGGTVVAQGGSYAAGIGGGREGYGRYITINGGSVTATGGNYGAGIGGGREGGSCMIVINSDDVTATGKNGAANIGGGANMSAPGTVTFDANGGTGTMTDLVYVSGYITLPENGFTAPDGKFFAGWNVRNNQYKPGVMIRIESDTTITAQWSESFTITFAPNGGTGTMDPVTLDTAMQYTLPECAFTAPNGKIFKAWRVGGEEKNPGDKITVSAATTVTAIWQDVVKYDLWVGGVQVTSANADGITGEGISGTVTYDHETRTLTLNNAAITEVYDFWEALHDSAGIYVDQELTINLIGSNTITGKDIGGSSYGIYSDGGNLTVKGNGNLTVSSADSLSGSFWTVGIFCSEDIIVADTCTIVAFCGTRGTIKRAIYCYGDFKLCSGLIAAGNKNAPDDTAMVAFTGSASGYLYLKFSAGSAVTLNTNGGTIKSENVTYYFTDTGAELPTDVTRSGHIFAGWYDNAELSGEPVTKIPAGQTGDKTYWAKWEVLHVCSVSSVAKVNPTCTEPGKEAHYKCDGCGKFYEDSSAKTEITNIDTWGIIDALGHAESDWKSDDNYHWKECTRSNCGAKIEGTKASHKATGDNAATCNRMYICDICNVSFGVKDPGNHAGGTTIVNASNPDHKHQIDGYTGDTKCLGCGRITAHGQAIPAGAHTPASTWTTDGTHHWKVCTVAGCGVVISGSKEAHTSTGNNVATCQKLAVCDTCGVSYGAKAAHDPAEAWNKDETGHWHSCKTPGCTDKLNFAGHTPDHQGGATEEYAIKCTDCGYVIEQQLAHTHVFNKEVAEEQYLVSGATCTSPAIYYKSCVCGEQDTTTFESGAVAAHTPDRAEATETDPIKCSVCGYEIAPALGHTHAHRTDWKSDADNHWNECACGDKANTAAHKDENTDGKCDVCAYNVGLPTPPADPSNPQTGDNTRLGLWITLLIVSSFGVAAITLFGKKKYSVR